LYCTYLYCTHYSAYIKAVPCINLIAEYNIQSYFAHFQSLFSLPLLILNMVSEPLSCGLHYAKSGVPPLLRVHGLFPEIANPLAVSAFLGILISELLFDSKQPSLDRSHQDLSIETKIGRIQPRTRPHAPPEVSGSPATRARAPTCRPAPPRALTRSHAPHACFFSVCHVSPSNVTLTSALVTSSPRQP
jgi:hypothetical protein